MVGPVDVVVLVVGNVCIDDGDDGGVDAATLTKPKEVGNVMFSSRCLF